MGDRKLGQRDTTDDDDEQRDDPCKDRSVDKELGHC
jgi:hypothetical protein